MEAYAGAWKLSLKEQSHYMDYVVFYMMQILRQGKEPGLVFEFFVGLPDIYKNVKIPGG